MFVLPPSEPSSIGLPPKQSNPSFVEKKSESTPQTLSRRTFGIIPQETAPKHFSYLQNLFVLIGQFFSRRYAQLHLIYNGFVSMDSCISEEQIEKRVCNVKNLQGLVTEMNFPFPSLDAEILPLLQIDSVQNLFLSNISNSLNCLAKTNKLEEFQAVKGRILWECRQVMNCQSKLVFDVYCLFFKKFPGTVPYVRGNIPLEVQLKAKLIDVLGQKLDELGYCRRLYDPRGQGGSTLSLLNKLDCVPQHFFHPATYYFHRHALLSNAFDSIKKIPIFDAHHYSFSKEIRKQHSLDNEIYEDIIHIKNIRRPMCPCCTGLISPVNARIDVSFQDEILKCLIKIHRQLLTMNAVPTNIANSATSAIPGTIKYNPRQIPTEIFLKAVLIDELSKDLQDDVSNDFNCPISLEIMSLPIFDSSHQDMQAAIENAKSKGEVEKSDNAKEAGELSNRTLRHLFDHSSLKALNRCALCRHLFQKDHFLIDTELQDRILERLMPKGILKSMAPILQPQRFQKLPSGRF